MLKTRKQIREILLLLENFCGYFICEGGSVSFCRCCFWDSSFLGGASTLFVFAICLRIEGLFVSRFVDIYIFIGF